MAVSAKDVKELRARTDAPMMECKKALEEAGGDLEAAVKVLRERGIAKMAKRADRETLEGVVRIGVPENGLGGTSVVVTCETDFTARNDAFQKLADEALAAAQGIAGDELSAEKILEQNTSGGGTVKALLDETTNAIRENMTIQQVARFGGPCGAYTHFDGKSGALVEFELGDDAKASTPEFQAMVRDIAMHVVAIDPAPLAVTEEEIDPAVVEAEKEILIKQAMDSGKPEEIAKKMVEGRMKKFYSERALNAQPFVKDPSSSVAEWAAAQGKSMGTTVAIKRFARLQIGG